MLTQTTSYDHPTDKDQIDCVEQGAEGDRYPVLHIGATTAWPSREHLVAIRDAIQGYLDAHPQTPEEAATAELDNIAAGIVAADHAEALDDATEEQAITPLEEEPWF